MAPSKPNPSLTVGNNKWKEEQQGTNKRQCTKETPERMKRKDEQQKEKMIMTVDLVAGKEDEEINMEEVVRNLDSELKPKDIKVTDKRFWTQPIKEKTKRWTKNMQKTKLEGYKKHILSAKMKHRQVS